MFMRLAFKPWICNVDPYILTLCAKRHGLSLTFIYNFVLYSKVTRWPYVHITHHVVLVSRFAIWPFLQFLRFTLCFESGFRLN